MKVTAEVVALKTITEKNFMGRKTWLHARKNELGTVIDVDADGVPTVRWHRTGTATIVDMGREAKFCEPSDASLMLLLMEE
jgi:hypothetical protein